MTTMRQEIEVLAKHWEDWEPDDNQDAEEIAQVRMLKCAASRLRAILARHDKAEPANGWIRVEERPPINPGRYDACWERLVPRPVYEPMPLDWDGQRWERELHPTHWRPIPSPPKITEGGKG